MVSYAVPGSLVGSVPISFPTYRLPDSSFARPQGCGPVCAGGIVMRGKWSKGIEPRNFGWIIKDQIAICERPGGQTSNHRRVRRHEEIIWIREHGFARVISLMPSPHNLHAYDELNVTNEHVPMGPHDDAKAAMSLLFPADAGLDLATASAC